MLAQRIFGRSQEQTQAGAVEQIIPEPVDHHAQLVSHAENGYEMNEEPCQPCVC